MRHDLTANTFFFFFYFFFHFLIPITNFIQTNFFIRVSSIQSKERERKRLGERASEWGSNQTISAPKFPYQLHRFSSLSLILAVVFFIGTIGFCIRWNLAPRWSYFFWFRLLRGSFLLWLWTTRRAAAVERWMVSRLGVGGRSRRLMFTTKFFVDSECRMRRRPAFLVLRMNFGLIFIAFLLGTSA